MFNLVTFVTDINISICIQYWCNVKIPSASKHITKLKSWQTLRLWRGIPFCYENESVGKHTSINVPDVMYFKDKMWVKSSMFNVYSTGAYFSRHPSFVEYFHVFPQKRGWSLCWGDIKARGQIQGYIYLKRPLGEKYKKK